MGNGVAYASTGAGVSQNCTTCIREVEGGSSQVGLCRWDVNSESCGDFQIKKPYWKDCGKLEGDWKTCAKSEDCSRKCATNYLNLWGGRAGASTCEDYARIHNGGPQGHKKNATMAYAFKVKKCCDEKFGGKC